MKNLAGVKECDTTIKEELYLADIEAIPAEAKGEVPYSIEGKIGNWKLRRAWYYWVASVEILTDGLPVDDAMELHNKPNPIDSGKILGTSIRSGGHCGCPSPNEYGADPDCNTGKLDVKRYVRSYHIDDQIGLNEFKKALKTYYSTEV